MHLVHDDAAERQFASFRRRQKKNASSIGSRSGAVTRRNVVCAVAEQLVDALGALAEALGHVAEALEELRQVLEQVDPGDSLERREQDAAGAPEHPHAERARAQEELQRLALDEARHPLGRVDEVERVAGRRRVEHEQVVAASWWSS